MVLRGIGSWWSNDTGIDRLNGLRSSGSLGRSMDDFVVLGSLRLVMILLLLDTLSLLLGLLSSKLLCLFGLLASSTPRSNSILAIIGLVYEGTATIALLAGASVAVTPEFARDFGDLVVFHYEGWTGVENLQVSVKSPKK